MAPAVDGRGSDADLERDAPIGPAGVPAEQLEGELALGGLHGALDGGGGAVARRVGVGIERLTRARIARARARMRQWDGTRFAALGTLRG